MLSNVKTKTNQVLRKSYWKKQPFIFTVYLMNHVFQTFLRWPRTIIELKELNWLYCVNIWKTSEAANLAFQWIFVLNSIKHKFFHVSIVKLFWFQSWDFKHNYAKFRYYQSCKRHIHSRLAIPSMIYYSVNFSARNWLNKQSRRLEGLLGFQRKNLRWSDNMYSFKQFRSSLNGLLKVVLKK